MTKLFAITEKDLERMRLAAWWAGNGGAPGRIGWGSDVIADALKILDKDGQVTLVVRRRG